MTSINVYVVEQDASANYRLKWPAESLRSQGADVEICETGVETRDADICVFNRPIRQIQADAIEQLTTVGKEVVVDMDDNIDALRPQHAMYGCDTSYLHRACKAATRVTVSTPALLDVYGYGHGIVVPNCIPSWMLDITAVSSAGNLWVGWGGTVTSHPNDLQATQGGVAKAMSEHAAELVYVGPKMQSPLVRNALKWKGKARCSGWFADHDLYAKALALFDVGIVPLESCIFNDGKSWLKGLELAAVGVPFVASHTPEYRKLGTGAIAKNYSDWRREVGKLLASAEYRAESAGRGREVASNLTIEGNSGRWLAAWIG